MKNRLLATLLILTAVPFFAGGATIKKPYSALRATKGKPNNAKLLVHLKTVKVKILNDKMAKAKGLKKLKIKDTDTIFKLNVLNEFYAKSKPLQQYVSDDVNHNFNLICNHMKTWNQLFDTPINQTTMPNFAELYTLFEPIYTKLHKNYYNNNPNGAMVQTTAQEMFYNTLTDIAYLDGLIIPDALIKKIDAKIAELEVQR